MKIRILDRILVALCGLLVLACVTAAAAQLLFGKDVADWAGRLLARPDLKIWFIIVLALLAAAGVYCVLMLFRHRGHKDKFIMQKTENGELAISLKALESMVQKCLEPHKELTMQGVRLENQKGGLLIRIRGTVAGGVSIPLTVDALQQQIKQYVTACSGVEVKDIRVQIESSGPDAKDALFAIEAPAMPALLNAASKETPAEETPEAVPMTPEEIEQVLAEVPAPNPSDAEDEAETVVVPAAAAAAAELLRSEAPAEEDDRPIHQRLFSTVEEPCVMPMPPAETEGTEGKDAAAEPPEEEKPGEEPKIDEGGKPAGEEQEEPLAGDMPSEGEQAPEEPQDKQGPERSEKE